jgi:hypothetical protein
MINAGTIGLATHPGQRAIFKAAHLRLPALFPF